MAVDMHTTAMAMWTEISLQLTQSHVTLLPEELDAAVLPRWKAAVHTPISLDLVLGHGRAPKLTCLNPQPPLRTEGEGFAQRGPLPGKTTVVQSEVWLEKQARCSLGNSSNGRNVLEALEARAMRNSKARSCRGSPEPTA